MRTVSERVRGQSGVAERGISLSSGEEIGIDEHEDEMGGQEEKRIQEHWASKTPSNSTGSQDTSNV